MSTMNKTLNDFYLDYVNNYLTVAEFAEANGISENSAVTLLETIKKERESQIEDEEPEFVKFDVFKAEQANAVLLDGVFYDVDYTIDEEVECYCELSHPETKETFHIENNERFKTIEYLKFHSF